jgi:hypothetical protein
VPADAVDERRGGLADGAPARLGHADLERGAVDAAGRVRKLWTALGAAGAVEGGFDRIGLQRSHALAEGELIARIEARGRERNLLKPRRDLQRESLRLAPGQVPSVHRHVGGLARNVSLLGRLGLNLEPHREERFEMDDRFGERAFARACAGERHPEPRGAGRRVGAGGEGCVHHAFASRRWFERRSGQDASAGA